MRELLIGKRLFHRIGEDIYDFIAGGIGFSSLKGNYCVVLGKHGDIGSKESINRFFILDEFSANRLEKFLTMVQAKQGEYDIRDNIIGNPTPPVSQYLSKFNKRTGQPITIRLPAFVGKNGDLGYYLERLIDRLQPARRTLFIDRKSVILQKMKMLDKAEEEFPRDVDHPEIAALSYALGAIESMSDALESKLKTPPTEIKTSHGGYQWAHDMRNR